MKMTSKMESNRFKEHETYLLENWANATRLEASMKAVRTKYQLVFNEVLDKVQSEHPELDRRATDFEAIGAGKRSWLSSNPAWPSGLYIDDVSLENLACESGDPPNASVWLRPPAGTLDIEKARGVPAAGHEQGLEWEGACRR